MLLADFLLSPQMVSKILLLKISADASLLEHEHAAQEFIVAADAVFFKAQGLETLALPYKTVFGLLKGLLDNWRLLNLDSIEWRHKAEVCQACINLWSLNKQASWYAEFGKTVSCCFKSRRNSSALPPTQEPSQWVAPCNKGKGKAKVTEDDKDKEGEATQKLRKELEDFVVPIKFDNKLLASVRMQKKRPPLAVLIIAKHVKLVQAAKAFLEQQDKSSQFFVLEGYKRKRKAKALLGNSEQTGAKQTFKSIDFKLSSKPASAAPISKPAPVTSADKPAIKRGFIFKDPFMVRQFKLAGTEESGALIINQATEVAATQETLQDEESSDEDNNEDSNDDKDSKADKIK
ncbi:hypothetical protein C0995_010511 [Termitomyces sp. Mi166|nr:hypothetical protein C0995_010511 [Termitomyces sp. Mi166\